MNAALFGADGYDFVLIVPRAERWSGVVLRRGYAKHVNLKVVGLTVKWANILNIIRLEPFSWMVFSVEPTYSILVGGNNTHELRRGRVVGGARAIEGVLFVYAFFFFYISMFRFT